MNYRGDRVTEEASTLVDNVYVFDTGPPEHVLIDAANCNDCIARFINDSDSLYKANCRPVKFRDSNGTVKIAFYSTRELKAQEELRYDYGTAEAPWKHTVPEECFKGIAENDTSVDLDLIELNTEFNWTNCDMEFGAEVEVACNSAEPTSTSQIDTVAEQGEVDAVCGKLNQCKRKENPHEHLQHFCQRTLENLKKSAVNEFSEQITIEEIPQQQQAISDKVINETDDCLEKLITNSNYSLEKPGGVVSHEQSNGDIVSRKTPGGEVVSCEKPGGEVFSCKNPGEEVVSREKPGEEVVCREKPGGEDFSNEKPNGEVVSREKPGGELSREKPGVEVVFREKSDEVYSGEETVLRSTSGDVERGFDTCDELPARNDDDNHESEDEPYISSKESESADKISSKRNRQRRDKLEECILCFKTVNKMRDHLSNTHKLHNNLILIRFLSSYYSTRKTKKCFQCDICRKRMSFKHGHPKKHELHVIKKRDNIEHFPAEFREAVLQFREQLSTPNEVLVRKFVDHQEGLADDGDCVTVQRFSSSLQKFLCLVKHETNDFKETTMLAPFARQYKSSRGLSKASTIIYLSALKKFFTFLELHCQPEFEC